MTLKEKVVRKVIKKCMLKDTLTSLITRSFILDCYMSFYVIGLANL